MLGARKYILFLLVSLIASFTALYSFVLWNLSSYDSHRIYNIRKVPEEYRLKLAEGFLDQAYVQEPATILVMGDSQANGHLFADEYIFSAHLEKRLNKQVVNIAFQDARIIDAKLLLEYVASQGRRYDTIIYGLNLAHLRSPDTAIMNASEPKRFELGVLKSAIPFLKLSLFPNPKGKPAEDFVQLNYGDYFKFQQADLPSYTQNLKELYETAEQVTDNFVVYLAPYAKSAVTYDNSSNEKTLETYKQSIMQFCTDHNINCFNIKINEDQYFIDIVHLNSLGHENMANQLTEFVIDAKSK